MLTIRFIRVGKKNQPSFKIVVADKRRSAKSSRFVEEVGFYNPLTKKRILKKERVQYWIANGAKPSPTVYNLLVKDGIVEGKKIAVHKKSKNVAPAPAAPAVAAAPVAPATETPKEEKKEETKPDNGPAPLETSHGADSIISKGVN